MTAKAKKSLGQALWASRWPLFLTGILMMSVTAYGVLAYLATRPNAPRPLAGFYERSLRWDEDSAVLGASEQLGWQVRFDVPRGEQYLAGMPRPVDVMVTARDGRAVTGLSGELVAVRPSDQRLNSRGKLYELPHAPGSYRALLHLDAPGIWELGLDAKKDGARFVHRSRVSVAPASPLPKGGRSE